MHQYATASERFWSKVDKSGGCWTWTSATDKGGYGRWDIRPRHFLAHRWSYEESFGPIPDGLLVCHRCDNPPCVRPDHLFLGSHAENSQDSISKGRWAAGERHPRAKLTAAEATAIRALKHTGVMQKTVAARFGITPTAVGCIWRGTRWKSLA